MTKYVDAGDIDLDEEVVLDSNGNRITEARAEEMAEHALRAVRGRPSLTGASRHSPRVSFRLPDHERERAEQVARAEGKTVSALAREALERYLAEHLGA
jgi:hypothetical protein